jgi:Ca-activated chloride channel family protein
LSFENAWFLFLLAPVAAAAAWLFARRKARARREPAAGFPSLALAAAVPRTLRTRASGWLWLLRLAALALLAAAVARPRRGIETVYDATRGVDIALCIDVSGSMRQPFDPTRRRAGESKIEVAKRVAVDFVDRRTHDRIALVPFAKYAYRMSPLTLHHEWVKEQLGRIRIRSTDPRRRGRDDREAAGLIDETKTAIGTAIAVAANALRSSDAKSKVVVLLTDGRSNYGKLDPVEAAGVAGEFDVRVYTIGAGASLEELRRLGLRAMGYDPIDEVTLREVARRTGGRYFRAKDEVSLARIYAEIDELEKTEVESLRYTRYREHFAALAVPALVLVGAELVAAWTVLRRSP